MSRVLRSESGQFALQTGRPGSGMGSDQSEFDCSRRTFVKNTALGCAGILLPWEKAGIFAGSLQNSSDLVFAHELMQNLLKQWCDGMLKMQIHDPENSAVHGALDCPACGFIHCRCMDAVYPFFYMAHKTGKQKYLDAGIKVFEWSRNVTLANGAWTNTPDPKSWNGITVFGAIALAETLRYHGSLLDEDRNNRWLERLRLAGDFLMLRFPSLDAANINYGCTMVYAMHLLGKVLDESKYTSFSNMLAGQFKKYLTKPNLLIYGEGKPLDKKSPRGLLPVDLGYNVEESLNGIVMYALAENDQELIDLVIKSMESHLEFMLPDGGWDNSWGTRQFKWTYWGSRTSDGCQPAYAMMHKYNPAFGAAAYQNMLLMKRCTSDGLLHGGPHYTSHGVKPCIHHTFTHAKALAKVLDHQKDGFTVDPSAILPRKKAEGFKFFSELDTWLIACGPWRATVTAYDRMYRKNVYHPSGGVLSMLWHQDIGTVLASSMTQYVLVEPYNMQPQPGGKDFPLTPRLEVREGGQWYTNLYDLKAEIKYKEKSETTAFDIHTQLLNASGKSPSCGSLKFHLRYQFDSQSLLITIKVLCSQAKMPKIFWTLPIVSLSGQQVRHIRPNNLNIHASNSCIEVESNRPLIVDKTFGQRVFNIVPGFEAVPLQIDVPDNGSNYQVECKISVYQQSAS